MGENQYYFIASNGNQNESKGFIGSLFVLLRLGPLLSFLIFF